MIYKYIYIYIYIYLLAYRKSVLEYGMFHQVRVDGGRESFLSLGIQE